MLALLWVMCLSEKSVRRSDLAIRWSATLSSSTADLIASPEAFADGLHSLRGEHVFQVGAQLEHSSPHWGAFEKGALDRDIARDNCR
jgi:hypothetical protein